MKNPKILITIEQGEITAIASNVEGITALIVDMDLEANEPDLVHGAPVELCEHLYESVTPYDNKEQEVRDFLKDNKL